MKQTIQNITYVSGGYFYRLFIGEQDVTNNKDLADATGLTEEQIRSFFQLHRCLEGADSYLIHSEQPVDTILDSLMMLIDINNLAGERGVIHALEHLRLELQT